MEEHTIYLIKTAKAIDNNESVFTPSRIENARGNVTLPLESPTLVGDLNRQRCKIGKTRQPDFKRFSKYPKGTKFVAQFRCNNCHIMENRLLEIFNTEFVRRRDYGYEYFEGDVSKMQGTYGSLRPPTAAKVEPRRDSIPATPPLIMLTR